MPTARATRTIAAPVQELWELVRDPHHLPRWWPGVTRVEAVDADAFTEVMKTKKGKLVRADFDVTSVDEARHVLCWSQRVAGTPFGQVLAAAETELRLAPAGTDENSLDPGSLTATDVTIELRQTLARRSALGPYGTLGLARGFGGRMLRKAATATLEQALDGLERVAV